MKSRFASAVGVAVVLLAVVAACGGGEGAPGGEKQAYIDQIDPACEKAIEEADTIGDATDPATLEKINNVWLELHQQVKAAPLPSESFDLGQKFVASVFNISASAEDAFQSALINDNAALQRALNNQEAAKATTSETAKDYGFSECDHVSSAAESDEDDEEHEDDH